MIDINLLSKTISPDSPCGEDLEYDTAFLELEKLNQGKPEQEMGNTRIAAEEPNWKELQQKSINLLSRTKDLRVLSYLITSSLRKDGLTGFSEAIALLRILLEQQWDHIHPQLDPDDDNDPTMRVNSLMTLCDKQTILRYINEAPLVTSRVMGKYSLRDISIATGEHKPQEGEKPPTDMTTINGAFNESGVKEIQKIIAAVKKTTDDTGAINTFVTSKVETGSGPNFGELNKVLRDVNRVLTEQNALLGDAEEAESENGENPASQPKKVQHGVISSRDDVVRMLDKICEYYSKHEPSSPVPKLLSRAKMLVTKDFMEILIDLIPEGVKGAEKIFGVDKKK